MSDIAPREVHEILTTQFTDRYLERSGFDKLAFSQPYDPANSLCDYERTTWPAMPNARLGIPVAKFMLAQMHHLGYRDIEKLGVAPFAHKADAITDGLQDFPVLIVNGHNPDMQAALTLVASSIAIARHDRDRGRGGFHQNFEEMARISHAVGTRGFGPMVIGWPKFPVSSLVRISQMVMNPHLSFPNNARMRASPLPASFKSDYNDRFKADLLVPAQAEPSHPYGYHAVVSTPPAGTEDGKGLDQSGEEITVTAKVADGTIELVSNMKCGLLPVYAKFGRGKSPTFIHLGEIIPPDEVTDSSLPSIMSDLAHYRRANRAEAEAAVYYAEDPEVASINGGST